MGSGSGAQMEDVNRRTLLGTAGALGAGVALTAAGGPAVAEGRGGPGPHGGGGALGARDAADMRPAQDAARRLLPSHADQIRFTALTGSERFRVSGAAGRVEVAATSPATALTGLHWYLKYTCHAHISWAGSQLGLPERLPAPGRGLDQRATVPHRFALNDTHDGYTAPYADWAHWERFIDVMALHGCNELLITPGTEAVYHRLLRDFGYSDAEARHWIPAPSHQPWWLLQNMAEYGGPLSQALLDERTDLARRITARLRELGMHPVLPGFFGTVPDDFTKRHPEGSTVPQGTWNGLPRPAWLDPRTAVFRKMAARFYAHQRELYGEARHFKMDLLHEGGDPGDVPVPDAARAVEKALQTARPGATWVILGWQKNPRPELLEGIRHPDRTLIVDGRSDLDETGDREQDWGGVPYAFGSIPNFGGRTTLGAKTHIWAERFTQWRDKPGSKLAGTAYMPEGGERDPAAFELFSELAWRREPVDRARWFDGYARLRYGGDDASARRAFTALRNTAYRISSKDGRPHDSIFAARPDLLAESGTYFGTHEPAYTLSKFDPALAGLLGVAEGLRGSDAYRYDVVDTARQALANRSWLLVDKLQWAYESRDRAAFRKLATVWLKLMRLSQEVTGTHAAFLLGPWVAEARARGADAAERDHLERTARVLLTTWAGRTASDKGNLANYANRDWHDLIGDLHLPEWEAYLNELEDALGSDREPRSFDWYAREERWTKEHKEYPRRATGDAYRSALRVHDALAKAPYQGTVTTRSHPPTLRPGGGGRLIATFRNENGLRPTGQVDFTLHGLHEAEPHGATSVLHVGTGEDAEVHWRVPAPKGEPTRPLQPMRYELGVSFGPVGENRVHERRQGTLFVAGPLDRGLTTVSSNEAVFGQLGERYAINGAGRDLWKDTEEFGAIRRAGALRDGGSVTVRVVEQEDTGPWARAGIVVRNTLADATSDAGASGSAAAKPAAGFVNLAVTPRHGAVLAWDADGDGALDTQRQRASGVRGPVLLRLSRNGRSFHGELSRDDGTSWTTVARVEVPGVADRQDTGLFMTAAGGRKGARGTVEFGDWRVR